MIAQHRDKQVSLHPLTPSRLHPMSDFPSQSWSCDPAAIWDYLPDGVVNLDHNWHVTYLNTRAEQMLCQRSQPWVDRPFAEVCPELAESILIAEGQRAIAQGIPVHFEQDSKTLGLSMEIVAAPHAGGLCFYLRDVTARKKATREILEQNRLIALNDAIHTNLVAASSLPDLLQDCVETIVDHLDEVVLARIWLYNNENHLLELKAIAGSVSHPKDLPERISLGISIVGLIAQTRTPYHANDISKDLCFAAPAWAKHHQLVGFSGYPLLINDQLVGVLVILSHRSIRDSLKVELQRISNQMAIAIDRSLARAALVSRRESLLFSLASQIRNSLDLDTILSVAVHEIRALLNIDCCHFIWCLPTQYQPDPDAFIETSVLLTHESKLDELPSLLGECITPSADALAQKIINLEIVKIEDITRCSEMDADIRELAIGWGVMSELMIPLETRSGQLGAILCSHWHTTRCWTEAETELLQAVTDQLAIAIDQAELYAQSRAAAFAAQAQAQQLREALKNLQQTQAQLIHSEKMSSLGQLVAGIAHEINNPISFVSGNVTHAIRYFYDLIKLLDLYRDEYPKPSDRIQTCLQDVDLDFILSDMENLLGSMQVGADRICEIVKSLRNFSRLDEAEEKAVDIHEGLENTLLILQNRLKANGKRPAIEIIKQYGNLPHVNCYASQLNQVFMNILTNAIDSLSDKEPPRTITITTEVQPPHASVSPSMQPEHRYSTHPWLLIQISDNGSGISEEVRQKIFDPFFTTKPVGQGTGLGLSISHQIIVEKHRGQLDCQSIPHQGTTFTIRLPLYVRDTRNLSPKNQADNNLD